MARSGSLYTACYTPCLRIGHVCHPQIKQYLGVVSIAVRDEHVFVGYHVSSTAPLAWPHRSCNVVAQ